MQYCESKCICRETILGPISDKAVLTMSSKKRDIVQTKNPKSDRYVKIDRSAGKIMAHKRSSGPYKNVPIAQRESSNFAQTVAHSY